MPSVSIIVTTYRHESFIERTLQSLLDQTYTDLEILIGDDSPDEKTWRIIESFIENHPGIIRAWHHTSNKGIVGNMNFLIEQVHSKSSYIAFLEGDDMWSRNYLEKKLSIWKDHPGI